MKKHLTILLFLFIQSLAFAAEKGPTAETLEKGLLDPKLARVLNLLNEISALNLELQSSNQLPSERIEVLDAKDGWIRQELLKKEATAEFKIARANAKRQAEERLRQTQPLIDHWAQLASELDAESHNLLVFHFVQSYFEQSYSPLFKLFLSTLTKATKTQIDAQKEQSSMMYTATNLAYYPFYIFSGGRVAYGLYGFSKQHLDKFKLPARLRTAGTNAWEWMLYARTIFGKPTPVKAGLPMVIPQPEQRPIAGFLEYKRTGWSQFLRKNVWPPNTLGKQLLASLIAGAAVTALDASWHELTTKKLAPLEILRLTLLAHACDISFTTSKMIEACGESVDKCGSEPKQKLAIIAGRIQSSMLLQVFPEGKNISLHDLKDKQGELLLQIPEKYRPLFNTLFDKDLKKVEPLCQRVVLDPQKTNWQLEHHGLDLTTISKPRTIDEEP